MHLVNIKRNSIISTIFLLYQELGSAFLGSKKGFSTMIASLRTPFISTDNFSPISVKFLSTIANAIFFSNRGENTAEVTFPMIFSSQNISQNIVFGPVKESPTISKPICWRFIPFFFGFQLVLFYQ